MSRSTSKIASIRRTASIASGALATSASTNSLRRPCPSAAIPALRAEGARRRWQHHPLARQMRRQRRAHRLGAHERTHGRLVRCRMGGGRFVLGCGGLEFLELHLQLVEQLAAALGGGAEAVTLHLGDQQLQMRDHRLGTRGAGLELTPRGTLGEQRRLQRVDVVGKRVGPVAHADDRITLVRGRARGIFRKVTTGPTLSGQLRPPGPLRVPPIDPFQHITELGCRNRQRPRPPARAR